MHASIIRIGIHALILPGPAAYIPAASRAAIKRNIILNQIGITRVNEPSFLFFNLKLILNTKIFSQCTGSPCGCPLAGARPTPTFLQFLIYFNKGNRITSAVQGFIRIIRVLNCNTIRYECIEVLSRGHPE